MNLYRQEYTIDSNMQFLSKKHRSLLIWFTGLSGSGKSTIANQLYNKLYSLGVHAYALDGDNLRLGLNSDLGFSESDRIENIRRVGEVSNLMLDAGIVTLASFVSPLTSHRSMVKSIVGKENFFEVFISTPLEECERRDTKGLFAKARNGQLDYFPGINSPYEKPGNPSIEINTLESTVEESVDRILQLILPTIAINS
jgi:adenylylsulfate kinase